MRRKLTAPKPEQFCIGTNGQITVVAHHDSDETRYRLEFDDFVDGNPLFETLKREMSRKAATYKSEQTDDFVFRKPEIAEVRALFEARGGVLRPGLRPRPGWQAGRVQLRAGRSRGSRVHPRGDPSGG